MTDLMYFVNSFKQSSILIMKDNRSFSFKIDCLLCKCPLFPVLMGRKILQRTLLFDSEIYTVSLPVSLLLVDTRLGCFCYPVILPRWFVPLFSINIPVAPEESVMSRSLL